MPRLKRVLMTAVIAMTLSSPSVAQSPEIQVEPIDVSKIQTLSPDQVSERIKNAGESARNYQKACERVDKEFDGSPTSGTKIAYLKLKIIEKSTLAANIAAGATENMRRTALIDKTSNVADLKAIECTICSVKDDIAERRQRVKLCGDTIQGDPADLALLVNTIQRLDDLEKDKRNICAAQESVDTTLRNISSLQSTLRTHNKLMLSEVQRQVDAIKSNRIAKRSAVLNAQAERLYAAVATLAPVFNAPQDRHRPRWVDPTTAPVALPAIAATITPEMQLRVRQLLQKPTPTRQ